MKRYVVGFGFTQFGGVWLVLKDRPGVPKGWNGIGGKIEETDATPADAMAREWLEETMTKWPASAREVCSLQGDGFLVHFFAAELPHGVRPAFVNDAGEVQDNFSRLPDDVVPNLRWLVPMAREALTMPGRGAPYTIVEGPREIG